MNCGEDGGQEVKHLHFHIYPRKNDDGMHVNPELNNCNEELDVTHQKLKL